MKERLTVDQSPCKHNRDIRRGHEDLSEVQGETASNRNDTTEGKDTTSIHEGDRQPTEGD